MGNGNDDSGDDRISRAGKSVNNTTKMKMKSKDKNLKGVSPDLLGQSLRQFTPDSDASLTQRCVPRVKRYVRAKCKCRLSMHSSNANTCDFCLSLEKDPTLGLSQAHTIYCCSDCWYYSDDRRTWIQAARESKELLDYLLKSLNRSKKIGDTLEVKGASFLNSKPNSQDMKIRLALQKKAPNGPKEELFHTMEIRVKQRTCSVCLRKDPSPGSWSTVVQLMQYGSHKQSRLNLERAILNDMQAAALIVRFKQMGYGTSFFFRSETDAMRFCSFLSALAPIKQEKIHKINSSESCITVWVCPISLDDLVYLPPKVSASLGNVGPLVVCRRLKSKLTLKDPISLRKCTISAADYWKLLFEPLMTIRDLVEFVVLDVENAPSGTRDSLVHVQDARVSDIGKNDKTFAVRSHLSENLKPGDFVFGYDLCRSSINNMELEQVKDSQHLDLVLVVKKDDWAILCTKAAMEERSPEYEEFLKDLEKNREGMLNLSLNNGESEMMRIEA